MPHRPARSWTLVNPADVSARSFASGTRKTLEILSTQREKCGPVAIGNNLISQSHRASSFRSGPIIKPAFSHLSAPPPFCRRPSTTPSEAPSRSGRSRRRIRSRWLSGTNLDIRSCASSRRSPNLRRRRERADQRSASMCPLATLDQDPPIGDRIDAVESTIAFTTRRAHCT